MSYQLPDLPYDYNALEPYIDAQTMTIHHEKHHGGYVKKVNAALEGHNDLAALPIEELLAKLEQVPEDIRTKVRQNGGGHANHSLFWTIMSPQGGGEPQGELAQAIGDTFESFENFKETFSTAATGRFGSGWAWLVKDETQKLNIISTPNQDSPYMQGLTPILGLDVWEHAYYLKYQNERAKYVESWWQVVNWEEVARRYSA